VGLARQTLLRRFPRRWLGLGVVGRATVFFSVEQRSIHLLPGVVDLHRPDASSSTLHISARNGRSVQPPLIRQPEVRTKLSRSAALNPASLFPDRAERVNAGAGLRRFEGLRPPADFLVWQDLLLTVPMLASGLKGFQAIGGLPCRIWPARQSRLIWLVCRRALIFSIQFSAAPKGRCGGYEPFFPGVVWSQDEA